MKTKNPIICRSAAFISAAVFAQFSVASAADRTIAEFEAEENKQFGWSVTDDGVMGGLSKGKVSFSDSGTMRFQGDLSLENNGGFSTVRSGKVDLDLSEFEGLSMRVKGDGRTYEVRLGTDARYRFMEVSFMAEFPTVKGEWSELKVPFSEFSGSFRGRELPDQTLDPANIQRLGLLLADKNAGSFNLEVDWIRAYGKGGEKVTTVATKGAKNLVDTAVSDGRFKTLAAALTQAELLEALQGDGKLTVFAPTDAAFAKLSKGTVESLLEPKNKAKLQAILKYHVVAGANGLADALKARTVETLQGQSVEIGFAKGKVRVNDAALLDSDIECSNGVIHVIDSVLLPAEPKEKTILSAAKEAGSFGTLLAAVDAAGLSSVLEGEGPFTVFAPTDDAFAALPKGTVESLLKPENIDNLKAILTYHVVSGRVSAGDALNAKSAKTVNGQNVNIAFKDGRVKIDGANVQVADLSVSNGVIHVIDSVLIPSDKKKAKGEDSVAGRGGSAMKRIEMAIDKGVPLYNGGDAKACADVYEACLESLAEDKELSDKARQMLAAVLDKSKDLHSADARAWLFRSALDGTVVYLERNSH